MSKEEMSKEEIKAEELEKMLRLFIDTIVQEVGAEMVEEEESSDYRVVLNEEASDTDGYKEIEQVVRELKEEEEAILVLRDEITSKDREYEKRHRQELNNRINIYLKQKTVVNRILGSLAQDILDGVPRVTGAISLIRDENYDDCRCCVCSIHAQLKL